MGDFLNSIEKMPDQMPLDDQPSQNYTFVSVRDNTSEKEEMKTT
jgi:hypothetical protein